MAPGHLTLLAVGQVLQRSLEFTWFKPGRGGTAVVEFKTLFRILKKHLADGDGVPSFFRDLMAMITTVSEAEWGTSKDPGQKLTDETIRTYTKKAKLPRKLAEKVVYRLTPEILAERINERPEETRASLANDLHGYVPGINQQTSRKRLRT